MYKSYSIRSDLDNFLKSKNTNHDTLIKTLFGRSKKINTKTDVLTWLSDNPEDIELFKNWMRENGGKQILDKINVIASESANSKENTEDKKLYQAWVKMVAEDVASSKELEDLKQFVKKMFQSQNKKIEDQDKKIEGLSRRVADQGEHIEELQRELEEKKLEVKFLNEKIKDMEQKLKSATIHKNKLEEELIEERRQKGILANKFHEMEKKIKAAIDDCPELEDAVRAETEHKELQEAFNAKKAILLQILADCKKLNEMYPTDRSSSSCSDYMISSDDAANYIAPDHKV